MSTPQRKPAGRAVAVRPAPLPLPSVRKRIWEAACDLLAKADDRVITSVLANRFQLQERVVGRILVVEGMKHERAAAALQQGVMTALQLAREAQRSVEEDAA